MRKQLRLFLLVTGLLVTPIVFSAMTCTPTQQRVTYNTLATVGQSVDSSVKAYLDLVVKGQVATNSLPRVTKLYQEFQDTYQLALIIAQYNTNAVASQAVTDKATTVLTEITNSQRK